MSATAYALRDISLSDAPRQTRRVPLFEVLSGPVYSGQFEVTYGCVVNLHGQGTYDLAKEIAADLSPLFLERDYENGHDPNAVRAFLGEGAEREFVGYVDADTAQQIAREMDKGAELVAVAQGRPMSGRNNRGGQVEIQIGLR